MDTTNNCHNIHTHLELFLEASESFAWDHLSQSLYLDLESWSSNVSLTTRDQLTESIVNEHILGLWAGGRCSLSHAVCEVMRVLSYQCLDHENPLLTETHQELIHVDCLLCLDPLQHGVQEGEGTSTTHSCTAVDQQRDTVVFVVGLLHSPDEGDEGGGKLGHSVVWPGGEVILCH